MISLDTETTGFDFHHGVKPFLVTICDEKHNQTFWEWDVNPLTRQPEIPLADVEEIASFFEDEEIHEDVVFQNPKFDVRALETIGIAWNWGKTWDTLIAGHLLASNQPHDLTTMVLVYLGINVAPFEDKIEEATKKAQRIARKKYPKWKIAKKGLLDDNGREMMPSADQKIWKSDMWLPRAIAKAEGYLEDHEWWTVCSEYANSDSASTLPLFKAQEELLKEREQWALYLEQLKVLPVLYKMESKGITLNQKRLEESLEKYKRESSKASRVCMGVAARYDYPLELPKGSKNNSLTEFVFGEKGLHLEPFKVSKKTGNPSLDKDSKEYYLTTLPEKSRGFRFIKALTDRSKRNTAIQYMEGYKRFWLPGKGHYTLYPSLNPTGTDTLRMSSSNPNEQNISKKEGFNIRYAFGPARGREWWSIDYNNLELRIPAYECGEQVMIRLFEKPNEPPFFGSYHLLVCSILHPQKWKKCQDKGEDFKKKYETLYGKVKNGNFADQYGAMLDEKDGWGTADRAYGVQWGQAKVRERLSKIAILGEEMIRHANQFGYVETMPDKTVDPDRGYPLLVRRAWGGKAMPTLPLNYHVQGTACWVMNRAMVKVQAYLDELNQSMDIWDITTTVSPKWKTVCKPGKPLKPEYFVVMNVHDELVFDFPQKKRRGNLGIIRCIQGLMESIGEDIGVPLTCESVLHTKNWSEGVVV